MTHLSLFTGIGGLDLAAEAAGFQTVGQCEWADFPTKVLEKHWPTVPRWRDIHDLTGESFYERTGLRTVDLISGGFPCQPFSTAGKRGGKSDDRYLWPAMCRIIEELRPTWVCGENVAGIVRMALDDVLSDLEALGYTAQALIIPACAVEAPHERQRCAIIAYADSGTGRSWRPEFGRQQRTPRPPDGGNDVAHASGAGLQREQQHGASDPRERKSESPGPTGECREALAHAYGDRQLQQSRNQQKSREWPRHRGKALAHATARNGKGASNTSTRQGAPDLQTGGYVPDANHGSGTVRRNRELQPAQSAGRTGPDHAGGTPEHGGRERRPAEPRLGRGPDGLSAWMDSVRAKWSDGSWEYGIPRIATGVPDRLNRLKALGNAVVPAQFYPIFKAIHDLESKEDIQL